MQLSKIGSKNTYHKCMKELHEAKYIYYHPAVNRFHLVRISVIPLYKNDAPPSRYKQLDLFGTDFSTDAVPKMGQTSPDIDTVPVAKSIHIIKPNSKTERNTPSPAFLESTSKRQEKKTGPPRVPNSVQGDAKRSRSTPTPTLSAVEEWFEDKQYPQSEAVKFYNHYKSLGWKIQGKTPIEDWKPLTEKWMTNAKKWESTTEPKSVGLQSKEKAKEIEYLYDCFLENKQIFHHITEDHFTQLNLVIDQETEQQAWQQRINQLAGTNHYSLGQLWQAYLTNNPDNPLVQQDEPNLILLAKRIAVIKHFKQQKNK